MLLWGSTERDKCCEPSQEVGGLITVKQWQERHRYQHSPIQPESERESNLVLVVVILLVGCLLGMAGGLAIWKAREVGERWATQVIEAD